MGKRHWLRGSAIALSLGVAAAWGCAASRGSAPSGSGGSGGSSGDASATGGAGGNLSVPDASDDHKLTPDGACAAQTYKAKHAPAAVLIVLDRSSSMSTNGKWSAAQLAIAQAIDLDSFDNLALGLLAYPASQVPGPACLFGLSVSCGITALAQVQLADAGTDKSNATTGVRHQIYNWLTSHFPDKTATDASPGYDAMNAAIQALQAYKINGKRVMVFISDGGFSCTSLSSRGGYSDGQCPDWEYPSNVIQLLHAAYTDPKKPVTTFIIGVPGSDSTGQTQGAYATAPYHMRLALSAYAYAGATKEVPAGCDGVFSKTGADPTTPCHFDMTTGAFNAQALADVVDKIRGKALGCVYEVPQPESGTVDPNSVNVDLTADGKSSSPKKRADATDTCTTDGCWDYTDASQSQIELIGKACDDVKNATTAKVQILVGCPTVIK